MCIRELSYKPEASVELYIDLILKYAELTEVSEALTSHIAYCTTDKQYDQDTDLS